MNQNSAQIQLDSTRHVCDELHTIDIITVKCEITDPDTADETKYLKTKPCPVLQHQQIFHVSTFRNLLDQLFLCSIDF